MTQKKLSRQTVTRAQDQTGGPQNYNNNNRSEANRDMADVHTVYFKASLPVSPSGIDFRLDREDAQISV